MTTRVQEAALAWHDQGFCVLPTKADGTKAPAVLSWTAYQQDRPDRGQVSSWFAGGHAGLGLVCGAVSGNLEMLELEGRAVAEGALPELTALLTEAGLAELWVRITGEGYAERTPSGGLHFLYRVAGPVPGNTKLANRPATDDELAAKPKEKVKGLAETRGEGGYVVIAPSNGATHPTGQPWTLAYGQAGTVPTLTLDEREQLHRIFRCLDKMPAPDPVPSRPALQVVRHDGAITPGDDFEAKVDWDDQLLLGGAGWRVITQSSDGYRTWKRAGKDTPGISATTGKDPGRDRLYVFSSATEFDTEVPYTKFGAYALLHHGGDHSGAARELRRLGYGTPPPPRPDPAAEQRAAFAELLPGSARTIAAVDGTAVRALSQPSLASSRTWKPELDVSNAAVAADWLREEVGRGRLAGMFYRAPNIVHTPREGEEGYVATGGEKDDDGPAQVRNVSDSTLASRIQWTYGVYKLAKKNEDWEAVPALFPRAAAHVAVDVPDMLPNLRPLRGVTHSPILRADGTVLADPGYDPATGILHLPEPGLVVPAVPEHPTTEQLDAAVALIGEMVAGFAFLTEHDRANYLGMLVTPLLRALVPPPYKLGAIGAPQPGSGKTLLATVMRIIHGGVFRSEMPNDENELRKQVTTILDCTTGPVVHFDNVSGVLRSSTLAGLLTSAKWDDRKLGANEMINAKNDRLWVITGNNLSLGGDLTRRALWSTIDPGVPNPHLRTDFAIKNLEQWVRDRRGQLISALLTLVRNWVATGAPTRGERGSDSYALWTETVDGILHAAGVPGRFADAASARQETGSDDDEWRDFLAHIREHFGTRSWTAKEVLASINTGMLINPGPIPMDALPTDLADKAGRSNTGVLGLGRSLGRWLSNREGRWAGDLTVRCVGKDRTNVDLWKIQMVGESR
jgi:hypothetical protein